MPISNSPAQDNDCYRQLDEADAQDLHQRLNPHQSRDIAVLFSCCDPFLSLYSQHRNHHISYNTQLNSISKLSQLYPDRTRLTVATISSQSSVPRLRRRLPRVQTASKQLNSAAEPSVATMARIQDGRTGEAATSIARSAEGVARGEVWRHPCRGCGRRLRVFLYCQYGSERSEV